MLAFREKMGLGSLMWLVSLTCCAESRLPICRPLLWPAASTMANPAFSMPPDVVTDLQDLSRKLLDHPPHPVPILHSAGHTDRLDPEFIASRKALQDAGNVAVLALAYQVTHRKAYFKHAKQILLRWAQVNKPTGHPIDETKLEGMIWAYDLIACHVPPKDKTQILNWFEQMRMKKRAWTFGKVTQSNNHRIHHIKMLLLLDKILQRDQDWQRDLLNAAEYARINLDPRTGKSVDYQQRNALYYHNYAVQPWLEISLISGCCHSETQQAFTFLSNQILGRHIGNEFVHSHAKIDKLRAEEGFAYALPGGQFDVSRAASTIVTYYTIHRDKPNPKLWFILQQTKPYPWLEFTKARRILWQP